jgi:hypothetical protein
MIVEITLSFLAYATLLLLSFALGAGVLWALKVRRADNPFFYILERTAFGFFLLTCCFALIKTGFQTSLLAGVPTLVFILLYRRLPERPSLHIPRKVLVLLPFIAVLNFGVYFTVTYPPYFAVETSHGPAFRTLHYDDTYAAHAASSMVASGVETWAVATNVLLPDFSSPPRPYHYLELWSAGLVTIIFPVSAVSALGLCIYPLFTFLIALLFAALIFQSAIKHWRLVAALSPLVLLVSYTFSSPAFVQLCQSLFGLHLFVSMYSVNIVGAAFAGKFLYVMLMALVATYYLMQRNYLFALLLLGLGASLYTTVMPFFLLACVAIFCYFWVADRAGCLHSLRHLPFVALPFIYFVAFYLLMGTTDVQYGETPKGRDFLSVGFLFQSLMNAALSLKNQMVPLLYNGIWVFLLPVLLLKDFKKFLILGCIGLFLLILTFGVVVLNKGLTNSYQIGLIAMRALLASFLCYVSYRLLSHQVLRHRKWLMGAMAVLFVSSAAATLGANADMNRGFELRYAADFVARVQALDPPNPVGVSFFATEKYNEFNIFSHFYHDANYLRFNRHIVGLIPLNTHNALRLPNLREHIRRKMQAHIDRSVIDWYHKKQLALNPASTYDDSKLAFLKAYKINVVHADAPASLPAGFHALPVSDSIHDPISKNTLYILTW